MMAIGCLAYAELVRELQFDVREKGETRTQARLEGCLDPGRVDGRNRHAAIRDFCALMEPDQFPQLNLSLRSPGPTIEREDQRLTVCQFCDRYFLPVVIG